MYCPCCCCRCCVRYVSVGLAAVQGAVLQKASRIIVIDTNPAKFPIAKRMGAHRLRQPEGTTATRRYKK